MNTEMNKQNKKDSILKRIGLVVLGIFSISLISYFIFLCLLLSGFFFGNMCGNEIIETKISPDKKHQLLIFQRDCGASTGFSTQISILKKNEKLKNEGGNIFIADDNHGEIKITKENIIQVKTKWLNDKTVLVEYDGKARTFQTKTSINGVKITYKTL